MEIMVQDERYKNNRNKINSHQGTTVLVDSPGVHISGHGEVQLLLALLLIKHPDNALASVVLIVCLVPVQSPVWERETGEDKHSVSSYQVTTRLYLFYLGYVVPVNRPGSLNPVIIALTDILSTTFIIIILMDSTFDVFNIMPRRNPVQDDQDEATQPSNVTWIPAEYHHQPLIQTSINLTTTTTTQVSPSFFLSSLPFASLRYTFI